MTDFQAGTRAIIFDLDGVIVDSEPVHQESFRLLLTELGLPTDHLDDWERYIGRSDREGLIQMLDGRELAQSIDELLERKGNLFIDLLQKVDALFPDIPALVGDLATHYQLAIASGSLRSAIAAVLEMRGLRRYFPVAVSVQDVPLGKPEPDLYLTAARLLNVEPAACVAIEDSVAGVAAARAAGMRVIGITNTMSAELLKQANIIVSNYAEVRKLLLGTPQA